MNGTVRADSFVSTDGEFKAVNATVAKHGGVLAMDATTWRKVVPQRFTGIIVWTQIANDHSASAAVFTVAGNSNAGDGTIEWRRKIDYYNTNANITYRWNGGYLEFHKSSILDFTRCMIFLASFLDYEIDIHFKPYFVLHTLI